MVRGVSPSGVKYEKGVTMKPTISLLAAALALSAILGGCAKEPDDAVDGVKDEAKDAAPKPN